MFELYESTTEDLRTLDEAIKNVGALRIASAFAEQARLDDSIVLSYDAAHLYVWDRDVTGWHLRTFPHHASISDEMQRGWSARIRNPAVIPYLPEPLRTQVKKQPVISGGLITPFLALQRDKGGFNNPYVHSEGYLATIIHEFGHVYYNSHGLSSASNVVRSHNLLALARELYRGATSNADGSIPVPSPSYFSELYAFCAEYSSARLLWPAHAERMDEWLDARMTTLIAQEGARESGNKSALDNSSHDLAFAIGPLLVKKYPSTWPSKLLNTIQF